MSELVEDRFYVDWWLSEAHREYGPSVHGQGFRCLVAVNGVPRDDMAWFGAKFPQDFDSEYFRSCVLDVSNARKYIRCMEMEIPYGEVFTEPEFNQAERDEASRRYAVWQFESGRAAFQSGAMFGLPELGKQ